MFDESEDILRIGRRGQLTANVTLLMLKGAGYAAIFLISIWLFLAIVIGIGRLLPEQSRDTPDPINRSDAVIVVDEIRTT